MIPSPGHNSTFNHDSGSQFNVEFRPRVIFQCGIKTRGNFSTWNHDPGSNFNVESWPGITFPRGIITRGHNSTWNYDPGSKFHVESWPRVTIPHCIVIPIPGHNLMLNHDSGSTFNVESRPGVIIQRGIKTWGSQFNGVKILSVGGVVIQWPPVSGVRNSTWKIRWILSTARWIKTPRVEIQWGQNSILHRYSQFYCQSTRRYLSEILYNVSSGALQSI